MTRLATHRQSDVARALKAARKDAGNWQVELLPSGAICIIPCAGHDPENDVEGQIESFLASDSKNAA